VHLIKAILIRKTLEALKNMQNELKYYQLKLDDYRKELKEVIEKFIWLSILF
jgi:uncharacterized membrane-anchored protein YhcB (DUF1043 family)